MLDLPKVIELKHKYKYRLIVDESMSFGTVGRTGRGLTELYNVPASEIDMLVGSLANGLCATGGFCAGSAVVIEHQRINGTAFVFSAAIPALLAVSASEGINILTSTPSLLQNLHENIRTIRSVLEKLSPDYIELPSHPASAVIHVFLRAPTPNTASNGLLTPTAAPTKPRPSKSIPASASSKDYVESDWAHEERVLQEIVEETLVQGVLVTRAHRLRGQELVEPRASIKVVATAALTKKEAEKAAGILKTAILKVLSKRR